MNIVIINKSNEVVDVYQYNIKTGINTRLKIKH